MTICYVYKKKSGNWAITTSLLAAENAAGRGTPVWRVFSEDDRPQIETFSLPGY